ncbi:hypothetical protein SUGI_0652670 [Cryptomeria japonica]|uniref:uncharacterized protein LOC131036275 n=1 Tax=Cryptomeria japonica TaxID=3369 RepID=UPI002414BCAE|nr:uncharacterized protein LOC131036275 [Cryptomeria japonica]GLJ32434.1 hypothetical protein SUGI_0652670 [Cryptomeria japonica]
MAAYMLSLLSLFKSHIILFLVIQASKATSSSTEMVKFDQLMEKLMAYGNVPGAQLALAKDGHLKYFKAFGVANRQNGELLTTRHIMRYNSISKFITGVAILKLVQEGQLSLEDKPFLFLDNLSPPTGAVVDPRLFNVTIQHLLQHCAGWNDSLPGRNVFILPGALYASHSLGQTAPPTVYDVIRYMKGLALDFDPGSAMYYSNLGYAVLGRVIEKVSGMKYANYMQEHIFIPLGLTGLRMAESPEDRLAQNEVHYHGFDGVDNLLLSIFPGQGYVNGSYGIVDYRNLDSAAGWTGNAADAVRFMDHIDGHRQPAILEGHMVNMMLNAPMPSNRSLIEDRYFDHSRGLNVYVSVGRDGKIKSFQHGGAGVGAMSLVMRFVDSNVTFAFVLNTCPLGEFVYDAIGNLTHLVHTIKDWPIDMSL